MSWRKIYDAYPPGDNEAEYLVEVGKRIQELLGPRQVDLDLGMALHQLLAIHSITLRDGFVINDVRELSKTIGNVEAALIVAALSEDPDRDDEWWNDQRLKYDYKSPEYDAFFEQLLQELRAHPLVQELR
jgi:hypothetical protein